MNTEFFKRNDPAVRDTMVMMAQVIVECLKVPSVNDAAKGVNTRYEAVRQECKNRYMADMARPIILMVQEDNGHAKEWADAILEAAKN